MAQGMLIRSNLLEAKCIQQVNKTTTYYIQVLSNNFLEFGMYKLSVTNCNIHYVAIKSTCIIHDYMGQRSMSVQY